GLAGSSWIRMPSTSATLSPASWMASAAASNRSWRLDLSLISRANSVWPTPTIAARDRSANRSASPVVARIAKGPEDHRMAPIDDPQPENPYYYMKGIPSKMKPFLGVMLDFQNVHAKQQTMAELVADLDVNDLARFTEASIAAGLMLLEGATDAEVTF